jgi:hypothetical protein
MSDPDFSGRFNNNCLLGVAVYGQNDQRKQKEMDLDRKIKTKNAAASQPTSRPSTSAK